MTVDRQHRLEGRAWFHDLPDNLRQDLLAAGRRRCITDGEQAYGQGDEADGLYLVVEGQIRLVNHTRSGEGHLLFLARAGDWFGEMSTLDQFPRQQAAISDGESVLLHLPIFDVERLAMQDGRLWRGIGALASWHQRMALDHMRTQMQLPVEGRVMTLLSALSASAPGQPVTITHEQIAFNVGASRQRVNAALQSLKAKGLIMLSYRSVTLISF